MNYREFNEIADGSRVVIPPAMDDRCCIFPMLISIVVNGHDDLVQVLAAHVFRRRSRTVFVPKENALENDADRYTGI